MSIRLLNLKGRTDDGLDETDTDAIPNHGYEPLEDEAAESIDPRSDRGSASSFRDLESDHTSVTSEEDMSLHQAASEGSIDQVKRYLADRKNESEDRFVAERDRLNNQGYSALHLAARYNRKRVVEYLLNEGALINQKDGDHENTPLLLAAKYNMKHTSKMLLEKNANAKAKNKYGTTALHFAARRGNVELTKQLLQLPHADLVHAEDNGKEKVTSQDVDVKNQATPLHMAMLGGSEEITNLLIQNGANVDAEDIEGERPIHFAAAEDAGDLIVLLAKGALRGAPEADREKIQRSFVNATSGEKDTALHIAAQAGYEETVKTLVTIGADVNMRTDTRSTPLHLAAVSGQTNVVRFLVMSNARINAVDEDYMTPLHRASQFGRIDTVRFLRERGARIDATDKDNYTPLMCAVWKGKNEAVEYLIDQGSNITYTTSFGKSVLHVAIEERHYDTLELLLRKGADKLVNNVDKDYRTPVHVSALEGDDKALLLLLNNGANLDIGDHDEKTPLHYAAEHGRVDCVNIIGKESAGIVNSTDSRGRAPLHLAAMNGHIAVVEDLIEMGAETSCRDDVNWTPLDYASRNDWPKTMKMLLDNDAPVDAFDKNFMTPLHHAAQYGHTNCISLLLDHGASILVQNIDGKNCLDLAVEHFERDACRTIINHKRWFEAVQKPDQFGVHPMEKIIEVAPDVAAMVLDKCVEIPKNVPKDSEEYYEKYNFDLLDINPDQQRGDWYFGPTTMVRYQRDELLTHPLTVRLINDKWARVGRWMYLSSLSVYLLFVALLTTLVVEEKMHEKDFPTDFCAKQSKLAKVVPWITIGVACFQILKELTQAIYLGRRYLRDPINWFEFLLYTSTFVFMVPFIKCQFVSDEIDHDIQDMKWIAGSISILFAWFNLLLYLKRFPIVGLYVVMFTEIFMTLIQVLLVFSILIIAFSLSFYSLVDIQPDFKMPGRSFVRTAVMMIGELDYDRLFTSNFVTSNDTSVCNYDNPGKHCLPHKAMTYFIFILFMIVMSIIVMNLLVGLAVGDIESVRKNAYLRILKSQIKILGILETTYPRFLLRYFYRHRPNPLLVKPAERSLFGRLIHWIEKKEAEALKEEQNEMGGREERMLSEVNAQKRELSKQKDKMKYLISMIEEHAERTARIAKKLDITKDEDNM